MIYFEKKPISASVAQKNNYQLISRILFLNYHLSARCITATMLLPTRKLRRAAFKRLPMWHYSMQGLPPAIVTNNRRELLPHVFTFIPPKRESNFLWHYLFPHEARPGR